MRSIIQPEATDDDLEGGQEMWRIVGTHEMEYLVPKKAISVFIMKVASLLSPWSVMSMIIDCYRI